MTQHDPAAVAAALRELADRVQKLDSLPLSFAPTLLFHVGAGANPAMDAQTIVIIDQLGEALAGQTGTRDTDTSYGNQAYRARSGPDATVRVTISGYVTPVAKQLTARQARARVAELEAQLAAQGGAR